MRALYIWYSSGEAGPAGTGAGAACARRSRSSTAWRVTISSASQPREATIRNLPSSATAYTALRFPASVALPSCGTSRSRMRGRLQVDEAAREAAALGHEAQEALPILYLAAAHELIEHDVYGRRARIAGRSKVGEPALLRDRQAGARQPFDHARAEILRRHVRQEPVHVAWRQLALREHALQRLYQRVLHHRFVEEPDVLLEGEHGGVLALARRVAHPAAQAAVGLLLSPYVHAARHLVRVGKKVDPFDAQIEPAPRRGLDQACAGAVREHPAQEILVEGELGMLVERCSRLRLPGVVVRRAQAE